MFKKIYKQIEKFDTIVIVRHIGVDPDALASQIALRDSIRLTFPKKKVVAIGSSSVRFGYFPSLDKIESFDNCLLIIVDTPDKKRIDYSFNDNILYSIKIDHHPLIEKICDLEYIDDTASSASQIILELINSTNLKMNQSIAETLFIGMASDTNRFLFNSCDSKTFNMVSLLLKEYPLNIQDLYSNLYMRPLNEIRLQGYIAQNMIVTENGLGYIYISNDILTKFQVDSGSSGNLVNNFNYIDEVIVWAIVTEDVKNKIFKLNVRSRGPIINTICEKYNGGGHKFASGARIPTKEEAGSLIKDLDYVCSKYIEGAKDNENK